MKSYKLLLPLAAMLLIFSCKHEKKGLNVSISPEAGTVYHAGTDIIVKAGYGTDIKPDSVVYLLDSVRIAVKKDSAMVGIKTDTMKLGVKVITTKVYAGGDMDQASTNIVLVAAKEPEQLTYKVIKTFAHDTTSYTEGLVYLNGFLYESDGGRLADPEGQSSLRKTTLDGKVLQKVDVDPKIFAEGISIVDNKLIQLTWTEKIGYVYDLNTFKLLKTFTNNVGVEGWGMTFDGSKLYMDDSTNRIWFLDKNDYHATGFVDVYDDKGPINQLNELEFINGKIYANIYTTDYIVVIDPKTGAVEQKIDMGTLYPQQSRIPPAEYFNGIAYDKAGDRIFVTGKKWQHLYQVKFVKPSA